MKKILAMCLVACSAAVGAAQAASQDKPRTDQTMKDGTVMVTGCLADKSAGGQYMLTHATKATEAMTHGSMATTVDKDKAMADKGMAKGTAGTHAMSYELSAGENLQAHVGHKVEITGMLDKADMDRMKNMEKMEESKKMDKPEKTDDKSMANRQMKPMTLEVTSLRMISAACP